METKNFIDCRFDMSNTNDAILWKHLQQLPQTIKRLQELEEENKNLKMKMETPKIDEGMKDVVDNNDVANLAEKSLKKGAKRKAK